MPESIRFEVLPTAEEVAQRGAAIIAEQIRGNHRTVLGLATGSTPMGCYDELARLHREEGLSLRGVSTFNLDEYWGLPGDHPQSYRHFMQQQLFGKTDLLPWNTHVLNGTARYPALECEAYEKKILSLGGVDLWLLGIGVNGHIAFNEPGSAIDSRTRLVSLSESTIRANSDGRFFSDPREVPRCALTAGIGTIREARRIILLATGAAKAEAISNALYGAFSPDCPASLLQDHPSCTFILDREAASRLG